MIETKTTYRTTPAGTDVQQKLKSEFASDQGHKLSVEYNGLQDAFRIQYGATQRLFFFENEPFHKTLFRNEYGVLLGQLLPIKFNTRWLHIDRKKYRFVIDNEAMGLSLFHARSKHPLLTCSVPAELLLQNLDTRHVQNFVYCLAFAFAWVLE